MPPKMKSQMALHHTLTMVNSDNGEIKLANRHHYPREGCKAKVNQKTGILKGLLLRVYLFLTI